MPDPIPVADSPPHAAAARLRRWSWLLAGILAGAVLGLIFLAYLRPAFLLEVLNLRYCG